MEPERLISPTVPHSIQVHTDFDALAIPLGRFPGLHWMSFTINLLANTKEYECKLATAPVPNGRRGFDSFGRSVDNLRTNALSHLPRFCFRLPPKPKLRPGFIGGVRQCIESVIGRHRGRPQHGFDQRLS